MQHQPWLGSLMVAAGLRQRRKTMTHLLALNVGLRVIGRECRRHGARTTRLPKPPRLIDYVLTRPLVSSAMIEKELRVTTRGALNLVGELGMREITGRGRYRAWGIV
ncbi:helix-turn-helix domain-containing protein [Bradyrhizobium sp. Arg314]